MMQNDPPTSMEIPGHVIDYPARDMTITVTSGMTIGKLNQILASENQQLPVDVVSDEMTVGDLVAFDIAGPRQYGYGTLRDYVIGIEASDAKGRVFHAGGRVVKNVAGYDLCRLLIGAEGKLGTFRHLTFKLKPLPAENHLSVAAFRTLSDLDSALAQINLSSTTPQILDVVNSRAAIKLLPEIDSSMKLEKLAGAEAFVIAGFDGSRKACEWQTKMYAQELLGKASFITSIATPQVMTSYCRAAMRSTAADNSGRTACWVKLTTSPSRVVSALQIAKTFELSACGRAGNGVLYLYSEAPVKSEALRDCIKKLVEGVAGYVEIRDRNSTFQYPAPSPSVDRYANLLATLLG